MVPLLSYPNPNKPYVLYTDASNTCISAVLTQVADDEEECLKLYGVRNEKPIFFLSEKLSRSQVKWSTIEKGAFAIHYALQKLDHYLHNADFVIRTDHKPLKNIIEGREPMQHKKLQLWALGIAGYNCKIEYIAGTANVCADLLSRIPSEMDGKTEDKELDHEDHDENACIDIDDRCLEIDAKNSNRFNPRQFASCRVEFTDELQKPELDIPDFDLVKEQEQDPIISQLKIRLQIGEATKTEHNRHMLIEGLVYYLSNSNAEPILRLYVSDSIKYVVLKKLHDYLGHMALDKTYDSMRLKYNFPNMYKEIYEYIDNCVTCQTRSSKVSKPPLQETDIPPYPFAKIGLDLSGPYPRTLSGNMYIVSFIDFYSGWPMAFAVPDKSAENIVHLLIEEVFPVHSSPLQILTDNGKEQVNRAVKETWEILNIHHVTTSYYSPQGNGKVERFHETMHDIIAKKIKQDVTTWDLYLNKMLAAVRFHVNDSSHFTPCFLLYNRDLILPLDTILKRRRKYNDEEFHKIALQQQHKSFLLVHKHLKQAKKRQNQHSDKGSKEVNLKVGDPVYLKNHRKTSKLDNKWTPYYRIIDQTSPVSFRVKNQLTGVTTKANARHLRLASLEEWEIPTENRGRPLRKSVYVEPPGQSGDESSSESSDSELPPLNRAVRKKRVEREDWSSEDDIPLMELKKRLRGRKLLGNKKKGHSISVNEESSDNSTDVNSEVELSVNTFTRNSNKVTDKNNKLKNVLQSILDIYD